MSSRRSPSPALALVPAVTFSLPVFDQSASERLIVETSESMERLTTCAESSMPNAMPRPTITPISSRNTRDGEWIPKAFLALSTKPDNALVMLEYNEQTENLMLPDCAKEPQFEKAYRLLNLSDHEFNAIRNGSLESLGEDRTRLILDKALSWAAQNYAGWDLYRHLRDELGMSNEEIGKAGFDLDEFYEVEAADSAEYEVEADYGEEL